MGCFWCINDVGADDADDPNLIIDVEKILADAAWHMFIHTFGKYRRRFLKRSRYKIDVPMNYFHFEEVEKSFRTRNQRTGEAIGVDKSNGPMAGKSAPFKDKTSPEQIGQETEFNNDTDEKQKYTFQFEKVRTASVDVSYQRGYSIGGKANFSIGVPKVLGDGSIGAELEGHLEVTKATGQRFEQSLKTSATSDIVVSERSRYVASVVMEEKTLLADFTIVMEMSMPAGKAPIYITDTKTGQVIFVRTVRNLANLFKKYKDIVSTVPRPDPNPDPDPASGPGPAKTPPPRPDRIRLTVHGIIDGIQLSTHRINLYTQASEDGKTAKERMKPMSEATELIQLNE